MTRSEFRQIAAVVGILILASRLHAQTSAVGDDYVPQSVQAIQKSASLEKHYLGLKNCYDCHDHLTESDREDRVSIRICKTESKYWDQDLHKNAYRKIVESDRGKQIVK